MTCISIALHGSLAQHGVSKPVQVKDRKSAPQQIPHQLEGPLAISYVLARLHCVFRMCTLLGAVELEECHDDADLANLTSRTVGTGTISRTRTASKSRRLR
jgi:hypothetical protein